MTDKSRKDYLREIYHSLSEQYDKAILTLSSGGLAISIALFKADLIGDHGIPIIIGVLAWVSFIAAIIAVIKSMEMAIDIADTMIDLEDNSDGEVILPESIIRKSWFTTQLSKIAGTFFIFAIVLNIGAVTITIFQSDCNPRIEKSECE